MLKPHAIEQLRAIVARERDEGCTMADESLIAPALRRWGSYDRRFRKHRTRTLEHRAHDLELGLRELFPDHRYDPGCLQHLARSFTEALIECDNSAAHKTPDEPT